MRPGPGSGFLYQLTALFVAVIVVHTVYVVKIRPEAEALLAEQQAKLAAGELVQMQRSIYIVVQDFEQETCFILAIWATAIIALKANQIRRERALLQRPLLPISAGTPVLPEDVRKYIRPLQALPDRQQALLLPRALQAALHRFASTRNIQDVSMTVQEICATEAERLDTELSMIRYIIWAIPSIGFIGTVRGIGMALSQAPQAMEGDIMGVAVSLGVAFNSTFIALVISIFIMFLIHQLQLAQERLVLDSRCYCDAHLIRHLQIR